MVTKRRTLTEAMAQTHALAATRKRASVRTSRATRERVAPRAPDAAIRAYSSVMATYAERVQKAVERLVLSRLPVLGSGDPLDGNALEQGLRELEQQLGVLAEGVRKSATATGKRVSAHGRREIGRVMAMTVPDDLRSMAPQIRFVERQIELVRRAGEAQVAQIRKAIVDHAEGESLRQKILDSLWVSRNRTALIASDQAHKLHAETVEQWSRAVGSSHYVWCTCRDHLVRRGHAVLDGTTHAWDDPPNTGRQEGNNHPGHAVACRCRSIPAESPELAR